MKYERINKKYTKTIIISFIVIIIIGSVLVLNITKAKYKTTISVKIVNGTIKYSGGNADLNVMAVYQQKEDSDCTEDGCYNLVDDIPNVGYKIDIDNSYCTEPNNQKKQSNVISFKGDVLSVKIAKKGTKCYLYFNKTDVGTSEQILADFNIQTAEGIKSGFGTIDETEHLGTNGKTIMYSDEDDFGITYYFRGKVKDNWVQFGTDKEGKNIYWRIIRINGDGTLRLIYAGVGENTTSLSGDNYGYVGNRNSQLAGTSFSYNKLTNNNKYVGYQYKDNVLHGTFPTNESSTEEAGNSNALTELYKWFEENLIEEWDNGNGLIDSSAGFCNDRSNSTNYMTEWGKETDNGGIGTTSTYYGSYLRLRPGNQNVSTSNPATPTFKCKNIDGDYFTYTGANRGTQSLTYPIGLITTDELVYAGMLDDKINNSSYLFTNANYWTMSPANNPNAMVFSMYSGGRITYFYVDNEGIGLRPVINLRVNTIYSGCGIFIDPYVLS